MYEFYRTYNGKGFAAVRHNTTAPYSIYAAGELIGETRNAEAAEAMMTKHAEQVEGQLVLV